LSTAGAGAAIGMSAAVAGAAANIAIVMALMTSLFMTTPEPTTKIFRIAIISGAGAVYCRGAATPRIVMRRMILN
jgi:uncharacterized membrane protein YkgB